MLIVVKELDCKRLGQTGCLVTNGTDYWVVSSLDAAFDTGLPETLAFPATPDGKIKSYLEVAGGRFMSREDVIAQLEDSL